MKATQIALLSALIYLCGLCGTYSYGLYKGHFPTKNVYLPSQMITREGSIYICFAGIASILCLYCEYRFYKYCRQRIPKSQSEPLTILFIGAGLAVFVEVFGIAMIIWNLQTTLWTHIILHSLYLIVSPIRYLINDYEISFLPRTRVNRLVYIFDICLLVANVLYVAAFIIMRKGMKPIVASIISVLGYLCLIVNNFRIVYQTSLIGGKPKKN